jgi:hypothetical protein
MIGAMSYWLLRQSEVVLCWIAIPALLICLLPFPAMFRMLLTGEGLVLTETGIRNYTSFARFIPRGEIADVRVDNHLGIDVIALEIRDLEKVLCHMGVIERMLSRFTLRSSGIGPSISVRLLDGEATEIEQVLRRYVDDAGGRLPDSPTGVRA